MKEQTEKQKAALNKRRITQLKNDIAKLKTPFDISCIVGVLQHTELINSKDIIRVIENCKISKTPLYIGYKGKEIIILTREDCL